ASGVFDCEFDFVAHALVIRADSGERRIALRPRSVANFYRAVMDALPRLGVPCAIDRIPNELPDAIPFDRDETHKSYDEDAAHRFWSVLLQCDRVFKHFRTGFLALPRKPVRKCLNTRSHCNSTLQNRCAASSS